MSINEQTILKGYSLGIFPMSESIDDPNIYWINPKKRGVIPLNDLKISKSLKKEIKKKKFKITINTNFNKVIANCAKKTKGRPTTWINKEIIKLYSNLHKIGHAHSLEAWSKNKSLLYSSNTVLLSGKKSSKDTTLIVEKVFQI